MKQFLIAGDICLFTSAPQDLKYSKLWFLLFLSLLVPMYTIVLYQMQTVSFQVAIHQAGYSVLLILSLLAAGLWFSNKSSRFIQVASALMGSAVAAGLFMLIYMYLMTVTYGFDGFEAKYPTFPLKMIGGFLAWNFAILAHILRHAFSKGIFFAMGLSFLLVFSSWRIMAAAWPFIS
ncbi:MAG: hypothetical protein DRQ61_10180 [Gammaproteobacteria bacterium]|nr:MAG: hypothetical protein DRQ56_07525 [Gammaproteobacteria bacterium]RLA20306.1 MAG: hypothetical protein DRQ61_10180 [Gammaproteobacteria bacterium]